MGFVEHDAKLCPVPNPALVGGVDAAVTMDAVQLLSGTRKLQLYTLYTLGPLMYLENTCSFR